MQSGHEMPINVYSLQISGDVPSDLPYMVMMAHTFITLAYWPHEIQLGSRWNQELQQLPRVATTMLPSCNNVQSCNNVLRVATMLSCNNNVAMFRVATTFQSCWSSRNNVLAITTVRYGVTIESSLPKLVVGTSIVELQHQHSELQQQHSKVAAPRL
jgi:hypothetical protein